MSLPTLSLPSQPVPLWERHCGRLSPVAAGRSRSAWGWTQRAVWSWGWYHVTAGRNESWCGSKTYGIKSDGKIGKKLVSQLIQTHKHGNSVTFQTHLFWRRPCFFLGAKENTDLHHNIRPTGLASHHLFYFGHVLTLFIYSYIMLHRYLLPAP